MKLRPIALGLLLLFPTDALAQNAIATTDYSTTIGTSSVPCWPVNGGRKTLYIENPGLTNSVTYCLDINQVACTPSANSAGSTTLPPATSAAMGGSSWWDYGSAPKESGHCLASGSSSPVTVRSGQ